MNFNVLGVFVAFSVLSGCIKTPHDTIQLESARHKYAKILKQRIYINMDNANAKQQLEKLEASRDMHKISHVEMHCKKKCPRHLSWTKHITINKYLDHHTTNQLILDVDSVVIHKCPSKSKWQCKHYTTMIKQMRNPFNVL